MKAVVRSLAASLLALVVSAAPAAPDAAPIEAATYNLRLNLASDGVNAWPQRREAVKALVRYHGFDLLGTQEGLIDQIRDLEQMGEYTRVGRGRDDGQDAGEHSAIFFRKARFELLANGDFWLSPTPEVPSRVGTRVAAGAWPPGPGCATRPAGAAWPCSRCTSITRASSRGASRRS